MSPPSSGTTASNTRNVVPLRRQFLQVKARFPDTILFFRLGDFYETFDGDAEIAANVLDIVLTGREMGKDLRVPMAGIPHHAAEGHIAKLIAAGHKVAVCEQIGEVTKGKGLVERDVTRVVTPGTIVDPTMLDASTNNYIVAVALDGPRAGIAFADITTGEFQTTELRAGNPEEVLLATGRELLRLGVSEIVMSSDLTDSMVLPMQSWVPENASLSKTDAWRWQVDRARDTLLRHFRAESLEGFGCARLPLAIQAAGGLLQYLEDTQLDGLAQINRLKTYSTASYMTLDSQTRRNLELTESAGGQRRHSLTAVLDRTRTPMGARMLRRWIGQPLLDRDAIVDRLDHVAHLVDGTRPRALIRHVLRDVGDIERLANRAVTRRISPRELATLRRALQTLPDLSRHLAFLSSEMEVPDVSGMAAHLAAALVDDPPAVLGKDAVFRPGFASELDSYRRKAREAREWIANLERSERERTGIRTLKVGYNRVFGYYLEITASALATAERDLERRGASGGPLPSDYIAKQSLANATRYFTPQLKEYESLVLNAEETLASMEADIFHTLVQEVASSASDLIRAAETIAYVDVIASLAHVAVESGYTRPTIDNSERTEIELGRHPVLESVLPAGEYVPNGACLDTESDQVLILTGPNMAGKSSWLRQVALISLMAQIGSFVPAARATLGIVDRIFTRIGAQDDIATGQSTFMVEMLETANILNHATRRSLIVLDEIGRGTSTYDGLAIARAIVEYLHNATHLGCRTLFATHYHELTELASILPRVKTYRMDVLEEGERVVFLRQVVPGGADKSYGVHVAQLAGIPRGVVLRAREILQDLEHNSGTATGRRDAMREPAPETGGAQVQLTFFEHPNPALDRLKELDVEAMSPLDAITALFELKRLL